MKLKPYPEYLIGNAATAKGLKIQCELDTNKYEKGTIVTEDMRAKVKIQTNEFHGEWNYFLSPN